MFFGLQCLGSDLHYARSTGWDSDLIDISYLLPAGTCRSLGLSFYQAQLLVVLRIMTLELSTGEKPLMPATPASNSSMR